MATKTPRALKTIRKKNAFNMPVERLRRESEILTQLVFEKYVLNY